MTKTINQKARQSKPSSATRPNMTIDSQTYLQVIGLLADKSYNAAQIAVELAKADPLLFLELHNKTTKTNEPTITTVWVSHVVEAIKSGNKVLAIKTLRQNTILGLKEAKDVVDCVAGVSAELPTHLRATYSLINDQYNKSL